MKSKIFNLRDQTMPNPFTPLIPVVNATVKKEIEALDSLFRIFPEKSLAEIAKQVEQLQEEAQGGIKQVVDRLIKKVAGESSESVDTILKSLNKLPTKEVKEVCKELGFDNSANKKQIVADIERWLTSGGLEKPLSKEERLAEFVQPYVLRAQPLLKQVDPDKADALLKVVDEAYKDKQLGKDGLEQFAKGLDITVSGTKATMKKQLRDTINKLSVSHVQTRF
jgi:formate dehydrogenase maturation protein FdhE